jgi:ABC-2 type transport system ATP-binding protein
VPSLAVTTTGLTKRYGDRTAVHHLDLELPAGALIGLVGPNGAGKTTTLRMLLGLVRPTSGGGEVLGAPLAHPARYLDRVGAMIEGPAFYPALSGTTNLEVLARLGGLSRRSVDRALRRVGLERRADDPVRRYSLGMRQRLGIAAALLPEPELLMLDEPTNGLDPAGILDIRSLIRGLVDDGMTVLVSSHLLHEIQAVCDHLVLMADGRLRFSGSVDELLATRRTFLVAVPEHAADLGRLVSVCRLAGYAAHIDDRERVLVEVDGAWAPELNRAAMAAGVTLAALSVEQPSLEDAFFHITTSADLESVA